MPNYTRASRDYEFVPGSGSSIEVRQISAIGDFGAANILDIEQGFIREFFTNKVTTNSGGVGETTRTRVGSDWSFALVLSFPSRVEFVTASQIQAGALGASFVETLLGSSRSVNLRFNIGDPLFWSTQVPPQQPRQFRAAKALLSIVETRLDATGKEVVGLNVAGESNSLLWTYLDDGGDGVPIHPGVWF